MVAEKSRGGLVMYERRTDRSEVICETTLTRAGEVHILVGVTRLPPPEAVRTTPL